MSKGLLSNNKKTKTSEPGEQCICNLYVASCQGSSTIYEEPIFNAIYLNNGNITHTNSTSQSNTYPLRCRSMGFQASMLLDGTANSKIKSNIGEGPGSSRATENLSYLDAGKSESGNNSAEKTSSILFSHFV